MYSSTHASISLSVIFKRQQLQNQSPQLLADTETGTVLPRGPSDMDVTPCGNYELKLDQSEEIRNLYFVCRNKMYSET